MVELFSDQTVQALIGVAGGALLLAVLLAWRRVAPGLVVFLLGVAVTAGAAIAIERGVGLVIEAAAPHGGEFNEHRWVLMAPWGRAGLVAGAAVAALSLVLSWRGNARLPSRWRRAVLLGLRTGAVVAALVLFFEPAIELRQVAREPNRVALLVDASRSMALADVPGGPTREQRARALIDASAGVFATWKGSHTVDAYAFAETIQPSALDQVAVAPPAGKATLIRKALEQVRARYAGGDLAGIVLVSDGVATGDFTEGLGAGAARDFLRGLDTRVHTVWAAAPGLRDVAIARVLADEFAFVRTVAKVEVVIRSTGYDRRTIPVTLSSEGQVVRVKQVELAAGEVEARVAFEFTPAKVGKYVYQVSTPVAGDEAVTENNASAFVVRVIRDKIRVLQVAGQPSWDVRALRGMLKQNPNVDLISFFILRTPDDLSNVVSNDELSLIPFPTRELFEEQLPSFDLVVLQNFDYGPYQIGPYLDDIRAYVESGGALVMLGGDRSFASGGYGDTPLEEALPVLLPKAGASPAALLDTAEFAPRLTEAGLLHPVTALRFEPADNQAAWRALPDLEGVNRVDGVPPDATVLAVHPSVKTRAGQPMPLVVVGQYGEGRTLAITTDSLWRWGFVAAGQAGGDGSTYLKFWDNAMRWLMDDPDLRYLHVTSDRVEYAPGETARLEVRLLERDYSPRKGPVELTIVRGDDPASAQPVARVAVETGDPGTASHELPALTPGTYRVTARATLGSRKLDAGDIFLVREASDELSRPAPSDELLETIAEATAGQFLGPIDALPVDLPLAPPRVIRVDRRRDVELWSRPALLLVALLFLGLEWALRQRSGNL